MNARSDQYLAHYAAQLPVIRRAGQQKLRHSHVHISGTGRIGGTVALAMAASGVGFVTANDPQDMESENLGAFAVAQANELGKPKVHALKRLFDGRTDFRFVPLVLPTESPETDAHIECADLIISCANTIEGRLAAERKAIRYNKPIFQVAAFDGRRRLGGLVTLRLPENRWSSCFACLADRHEPSRGEGLLATVTWSLAAIASNMALEVLTSHRSSFFRQHNVFFVDLERYSIEALAVERVKLCEICGANQRGRRR